MSPISEEITTPRSAIEVPPVESSSARRIFIGPNGLRAGWRLLIFAALFGGLFAGATLIRFGGLQGVRDAKRNLGQTIHTPFFMSKSEAIAFLLLCVVTLIMGKIESRKFSEYGLSLRQALRKDFWVGSLIGFLAISGTLFTMFLFHGFRVTGLALHGAAILSSVVEWGITFLIVGLCEEFMDRGYLQYTLASGIGFWPAAFVTSGLFAAGHIFNANETRVGIVAVVLFGLLLCFFLRRTGNLWCAVGFHMGYDWGQTSFYGVPNSGIVPYHNLFNSTFSGPQWLTGGIVGPEASVLTPIALLLVALIFNRYYRENRYQTIKSRSRPVAVS
jgi:membrane protease YdiL (CAAX protease family)